MAKARATVGMNTHKRPRTGSVEDVTDPQQNQDPAPRRDPPPPQDTENPPNENIRKDPDETYGDTQIPHRGSHRK
jgi:hypothetical protein